MRSRATSPTTREPELLRPSPLADARGRLRREAITPSHTRHVRVPALVVASELHHALGSFEGTVTLGDGERLAVSGLRGWAEEHRARW